MIHTITGTIQGTLEHGVLMSVGSFGLNIQVPQPMVFTHGKEVTLYTYVHWNQELGPSLYGFSTMLERTLFTLLISCSGIGPRLALAVLAHLSASEIINAIESGNAQCLSKVAGIGTKKAEHMIVHLKHKVHELIKSGVIASDATGNGMQWHTLIEALASLNYSRTEINQALMYVKKNASSEQTFDVILRQALAFLAQQHTR